jgi:LacI family transcriptional regulator
MDEMEVPLIFIDKLPEGLTANKIGVADAEVGQLAAEKLAGSGKMKIYAVLGPQNLSITQRRHKGFADYMAQHAPNLELTYAYCNNEDEAQEAARQALKAQHEPLAFFCMSDQVLCGVQKAIYQSGRHIPNDVALLAASNGFLPHLYYPEVSYVETSGYKLGKLAFGRMKEIMEGKKFIRENYLDVTYHPGGTL